MDLEHEQRLTAVEDRAKSNSRRIDILEQSTAAINRLATSVEVMATKQDGMAKTLNRLDEKVEHIEAKPGKRLESLTEKIVLAIVGLLLGAALAHFGL